METPRNKRYIVGFSFNFEIEAPNDSEAIRHASIYALSGENSIRNLSVFIKAALPLKAAEPQAAPSEPETETRNEQASAS